VERAIIFLVFLVCLLFGSVAGAIRLGKFLGDIWEGFLVVGGLYLILGCFLLAVKKNLIRIPVTDALIRYLFKNAGDE
jgi:hypothetical protein